MRSGAPMPFWMVRIRVSSPSSGPRDFAAAATSWALVATITSSQGPASAGSVVALRATVRSPLLPSSRRPWSRIAWMCSAQVSTAQTSLPASAKSAA